MWGGDPSDTQYGEAMSWWEYVERLAGDDDQKTIAEKVGIDQSSISRWKSSGPGKAENVAALARAYGRPVLEAFVVAGFLSAVEAKARPVAAPDFTKLTNDELLSLVRDRMTEEGGGEHGNSSASTNPPGSGPDRPDLTIVDDAAREEKSRWPKRGTDDGDDG